MSQSHPAVCLGASPSLKHFDQPLLCCLSQTTPVTYWEYHQDQDQSCGLEGTIPVLYEFLRSRQEPMHLIGHGLSGVLGLLFARRYPQWVRSLVLLGVSGQPAATWHAHYYVQRHLLPCSREQILGHMARLLLGDQAQHKVRSLAKALLWDLDSAPIPHSLWQLHALPEGGISAPLMICGSQNDPIVDPVSWQKWSAWIKPEDRMWQCPAGRHFFHYFYSQPVAEQILEFWQEATQIQCS